MFCKKMNYKALIVFLSLFFLMGFFELAVINEEALLCLTFISFVYIIYIVGSAKVLQAIHTKALDTQKSLIKALLSSLIFKSKTVNLFYLGGLQKGSFCNFVVFRHFFVDISLKSKEHEMQKNSVQFTFLKNLGARISIYKKRASFEWLLIMTSFML